MTIIDLMGLYNEQIETWTPNPNQYDNGCEGDLMTIQEYLEGVQNYALTDDDGYGYPVKDNMKDTRVHIYPSQRRTHIPLDATHIIWFNK